MGNCFPLSSSPSSSSSSSSPSFSTCRPSARCRPSRLDSIPSADINLFYELGPVLGRGEFGTIRRCTDLASGTAFACKSISKARLARGRGMEEAHKEIKIMRFLAGHPSIVEIKAAFQDKAHVHLVMELCEGGELYDQILKRKTYREAEAAAITKSLVEAIQYCHERGVMHRDLKPENILLSTANSTLSPIKLADFGLAIPFSKGQKFTGIAGSAYYIAPEVLHGEYSEEADIWSIGVILYILLSGTPPFTAKTDEEIFQQIRNGNVDFSGRLWRNNISGDAKDLIKKMLTSCVEKRITPSEILKHSLIARHTTCQVDRNIDGQLDIVAEIQLEDGTVSLCPNETSSGCAFTQMPSTTHNIQNHSKEIGLMGSSTRDVPIDLHVQFNRCPSLVDYSTKSTFSNSSSFSSKSLTSHEEENMVLRWMSFCHIMGPNTEELLASMVPRLECLSNPQKVSQIVGEEKGRHSCSYTYRVLASNNKMENLMVESKGVKFLFVIDRKRKRFGWKHIQEA